MLDDSWLVGDVPAVVAVVAVLLWEMSAVCNHDGVWASIVQEPVCSLCEFAAVVLGKLVVVSFGGL